MVRNLFKTALPHIIAVAIFAGIALAYSYPVLEGKRIYQPDIMNYTGMSKEINDYRVKTGEETLWTNSMFGGMPAYQISVIYKNNIARFFHKIFTLGLPGPANMIFLYMVGFYILMLVLGVGTWLAIVGAIAFAFSSYHFIIIEAGHNTKALAIGYMAPTLAGILLALRGRLLAGSLLTAVFLSLQIYANHFQITYYLLVIVLLTGFAFLIHDFIHKNLTNFSKALGALLLAAFMAVLLNITNLWTTYEYSKYTIRGGTELSHNQEVQTSGGLDTEYATQWSYGIGETFSLFIPNIKGGATGRLAQNSDWTNKVKPDNRSWVGNQNHYWGDQPFTSGPVYVGAIIFFLFVFGSFVLRGPLKWALIVAAVLSVLLSWGKNFMPLTEFFMHYVPGYNKFRAVSMTLVIAELAIPVVAMLGLREIAENPQLVRNKLKPFLAAVGLTAGVATLFYLIPKAVFHFTSVQEVATFSQFKAETPDMAATVDSLRSELENARISIFRADALRSMLFILLAAGAIWAFALKKIKKEALIAIVALLVILDMWPVDKRYLNTDNFVAKRQVDKPFQPSEVDQIILKDVDPHYRVLNLTTSTFSDAATSYFHKSIGGYHGAKLQRYQDLIDHHITKGNIKVLNMLNAKYIIRTDEKKKPIAEVNFDAAGNAWLVNKYKLVANADEEIDALIGIDLENEIVADRKFAGELEGKPFGTDPMSEIALTSYAPNRLTYKGQTAKQQIAVFSEIYYDKGWNAYLNGKPVPHFRANYLLRAIVLPAGTHEIEFRFEPKSFIWGERISLIASVLLVLLIASYFVYPVIRRRQHA